MTVSLLQSKLVSGNSSFGHFSGTFDSALTPGSLIVLHAAGTTPPATIIAGAGMTEVRPAYNCSGFTHYNHLSYRIAQGGDSATREVQLANGCNNCGLEMIMSEWGGNWPSNPVATSNDNCVGGAGPWHCAVTLTPTAGKSALILGGLHHDANAGDSISVDSGYSQLGGVSNGSSVNWDAYKIVPVTSGSYSPGGTDSNNQNYTVEISAAIFVEQALARNQALIV